MPDHPIRSVCLVTVHEPVVRKFKMSVTEEMKYDLVIRDCSDDFTTRITL